MAGSVLGNEKANIFIRNAPRPKATKSKNFLSKVPSPRPKAEKTSPSILLYFPPKNQCHSLGNAVK